VIFACPTPDNILGNIFGYNTGRLTCYKWQKFNIYDQSNKQVHNFNCLEHEICTQCFGSKYLQTCKSSHTYRIANRWSVKLKYKGNTHMLCKTTVILVSALTYSNEKASWYCKRSFHTRTRGYMVLIESSLGSSTAETSINQGYRVLH
jgi:hypothetical protein